MSNFMENRKFQFWHYSVSHGELLIRSPKRATLITNIDLIFRGVEYVELPRHLPDIRVESLNPDDKKYLEKKVGKEVKDVNIFVLVSQQRKYYVVANSMKIEENELDLMELPFEKL